MQLSHDLGLNLEDLQTLDSEGRALITDHGLFVLVNLYGELCCSSNVNARSMACLPAVLSCAQTARWQNTSLQIRRGG